jgi:hypothetical protein
MRTQINRKNPLQWRGGLTAVLLAAVLLSLLALPLTSAGVGAEDLKQVDPTLIDPNIITDPVVADPTVAADPGVIVDPVILDDPVIADPGNEVNDLYINPIRCPYTVDLWSLDYYGLAANCNLGYADGYELYVFDSADVPWIHQVINGGGVGQGGLPNDDYFISFTHPASGYSPMRIICSAEDFLGNDVVAPYDLSVFEYGGTVSVSGGLMYFCDAFIEQDTPVSLIDVTINKHGCPAGIVSDDPYFLASICQEMQTGIDFTLTDGNGNVTVQQTAGAPALATFSQVVGGNVTIQESIPGGYQDPFVMCSVNDALGNDLEGAYRTPDATGGLFTLDNLPYETGFVFCDIFNFPQDPEGGSIIIIKRFCPVDYDILSGDPAVDCGQPQDGVQFNATGPNGYAAQTNTGDSIPSAVQFGGLEAGEYQVSETLPAGVSSAWVWSCSSDYADLSGFAPFDATGSAFVYDLADNEDILCFWYNVPSNDGHVTIHKWECPWDIEHGQDVDYYLTNCVVALEGVDFGHGQLGDNAEIVSTDASGTVTFPVEPNTDWVVEEHVPSGYGDPIVFCRWGGYKSDGNGGFIAIDGFSNLDGTQGALIQFPTYDTFGMGCDWFNIPSHDDQSITIYKFTCPAGYDLYGYGADPKADCLELTNGVNFHLLPDGGTELQTQTGDSINGAVSFGGVEDGKFQIWEDAPADTVDTYVTCQWFDNYGPYVYQQYVPAQFGGSSVGNLIDVELAKGDELVCQWYNVPEKTWYGGDLTIYKYWCAGYVVSAENCDLGSGVKFVVTSLDGGDPILSETGPGGYIALSGLQAGAYSLTEPGYEWCKAVSTRVDAEGNILIEEGQETVVTIYNCTPDGGKKQPPAKKFPNTGAGEMGTGDLDDVILLGSLIVLAQVMLIASLRMKGVTLNTVVARIKR